MSEATKLRWGLLAAGHIARAFAAGVKDSASGVLEAVGSRDQAKADTFAGEFDIPRAHGSYEALLADPRVDAVYISTPHPWHCEWGVKAAEAGKHVLCEKPLGMNAAEAEVMIEAAERNDVFLMEAFMYRCYPQTRKIVELIKAGAIGDVQLIEAQFSFQGGGDPDGRLLNPAYGGGGILDVGCYPVSFARMAAGAARGRDFAQPLTLQAAGHLGATSVDEYAAAVLTFPGNILAQISTGVRMAARNQAVVTGTDGRIIVRQPWFGADHFELELPGDRENQQIAVPMARQRYAYEADMVASQLPRREAAPPGMTPEDSLGNMQVLDQWRAALGLTYPCETSASPTFPIKRDRPVRDPATTMTYARLPGVAKDISRLIMGVDNQTHFTHAAALFDDFIARGGNCFDVAEVYGGGACERLLGAYLALRGIREEIVLLDKDAHTPFCLPHAILERIDQRLENLQTDTIDLYVMHRDNPAVPAGEFVDVLNQLRDAGKIQAFGGSNWSAERIDAANAYAAQHGKTGFACVSNNFSLAEMVQPVWAGCVASSTPAMRAWHAQTQTPLLAWSSQARGFFTERAAPDKRDDASLVNCWYSDANFERKQRAEQLAAELGVLPINIALAYVLCQPFPVWALIGPRHLRETRTTWPALGIQLTPEQQRWLNLES